MTNSKRKPLGVDDAKYFAAGFKRLLRESGVPLKSVTVTLSVLDDNDHLLNIRQSGVPPMTRTQVVLDGISLGVWHGHPEIDTTDEQDSS